MAVTYYTLMMNSCNYGEFWRLSKNPVDFAPAAILKTLGLLGSTEGGLGRPDPLIPIDIPQLPARALARLEMYLLQFRQAGFTQGEG